MLSVINAGVGDVLIHLFKYNFYINLKVKFYINTKVISYL